MPISSITTIELIAWRVVVPNLPGDRATIFRREDHHRFANGSPCRHSPGTPAHILSRSSGDDTHEVWVEYIN